MIVGKAPVKVACDLDVALPVMYSELQRRRHARTRESVQGTFPAACNAQFASVFTIRHLQEVGHAAR